jgi:hypothetical protein
MPLQALDPNAQLQMPGMVDLAGGAEAQAKMYDIGAQGLGDMGKILQEHAAQTAKLTGALAGAKAAIQYDENGNLLPLTKLPMDMSITSQAFRESAINIYTNTAANQATQYARSLARDATMQADPKLFATTWNAYQTKLLTDVDPLVAGALTPRLIETGGNTYGTLADNLAVANKASAGILSEQAITEILGNTSQRVDAMGDTQAARDYIDKQASDKDSGVGHQLMQLYGTDALKFNPGVLTQKLKDFYQKAYGAMISGQAAQFGATEVIQPDGTRTGDSSGLQAYLDKLRQDPRIAELFPGAQNFATQIEGPAKARFAVAEQGQKAKFQQDQINVDSANTQNVGALKYKADEALLLFNQRKDASGIEGVLQQSIQTTFDSSPVKDKQARLDFQLGIIGKMNDQLSSPDEVEKMRLLRTALDPNRQGPNQRIPDNRAGTDTLKTLQLIWDSKYAQTTGQPGAVITAASDPAAVYSLAAAPHTGFLDNTGRILPRLVSGFKDGINAASSLQDANNVYANFLTMQKVAPDELKVELSDDQRKDILLWGESGQNINEYVHLRSVMKGGEVQAGYDSRANSMLNANKDKNFTYQSLQGAFQAAFVSSSTILGAVRQGLGFAPNPNVEKLPANYQQGWFGLSMPGGDDVRRALGYAPTDTLRIDMDEGAEKTWINAQANAAGTGSTGDGIFQAGLGDMFHQGYNISKLLMAAQIDTGQPGAPRDLTNDFTFGKYAPESYYKESAVNIAMDVSLTAEDWGKQPAVRERLQAIPGMLSSDFFKYGDKRFWAEQYTQGRLKLQPETGIGGKFLGYTVLGLLETPYENRWVPLNPPGQYYNYDQQSGPLAREALKGVEEGRAAAVGMETAAGTGGAARIAATVSAAGARYTAGEFRREFVDTGTTHSYFATLWETLFGGGTVDLSKPPSAVLKP